MKPASILANTDRTSWSRIMMVGRYFRPTIARKAIFFPLVALFIIFCADVFGLEEGSGAAIFQIELLSWMLVISPIMFAKQAADEVFCSLPALGCEKVTFIFLWSFVAVPLLLILPVTAYTLIFMPDMADDNMLMNGSLSMLFSTESSENLLTVAILSSATAIAVGLWAVFGSRRNRTRNAVLAILGTLMLNGLSGFILGFVAAWQAAEPGVIKEELSNSLNIYGPAMSILWTGFLLFALWKAARAIARKQV